MSLYSQTPKAFENVGTIQGKQDDNSERAMSANPNNFWLGSQVGYKFGGTQEFSDNLIVSGTLLYDIDMGASRFKIPVMGNISTIGDAFSNVRTINKDTLEARAQELLFSSQGISVGLHPYYEIKSNSDILSLTLHGSAIWKLNSFKNSIDEIVYLDQGRFSLGIEALLGRKNEGQAPLLISLSPILTIFNSKKYESIFREKKGVITSLEITGIVPIGNNVGLLFESIIAKKQKSPFRVGLIFSAKGKSKSNGADQ